MPPRGDYPSSKQDQYMLRFPDGMRDRLKAAAAENNRSLNAEIIDRLAATLSAQDGVAEANDLIERARHLLRDQEADWQKRVANFEKLHAERLAAVNQMMEQTKATFDRAETLRLTYEKLLSDERPRK